MFFRANILADAIFGNLFAKNFLTVVLAIISILSTENRKFLADACQIDNKVMHACLHTYLERDFSIIEELLKRPPYTQHGHILIDESELDNMCSRMEEMKDCYEKMIQACVAYEQYSHMKRVIKTIQSLYQDLCGPSFLIRHLIEGGYCIEYARQESICSNDNNTLNGQNNLPIMPVKYSWPLSLASMLRFEVGEKMCPYLSSLNQCLLPYIERRCRNISRELWNSSMNSLLKNWCHNFSNEITLSKLFIFIVFIVSYYLSNIFH